MLKKHLLLTGLATAIAAPAAIAAPGTPNIAWMPASYETGSSITTTWNMWWGENGTSWTLNDGATVVCSGDLTPNGSNAQQGTCTTDFAAGSHALQVSLCNDSGCKTGNTLTINVKDGGVITPPVNVDPTVTVSAAASVDLGSTITVSADAADSDGTVASVAFYAGATLLTTDTTSPYSTTFTADTVGSLVVKAVVTDNEGATAESSATVNVVDPTLPPVNVEPTASVSVAASAETGDVVAISANAADSDGTVTSVDFLVDGAVVATDTTAPYSTNWTATVGAHSVSVVATDNEGATATAAASINVTDPVVVVPGDLEKPATPALAWLGEQQIANGSANFTVSWNLWSGQNGNMWKLLENGVVIHQASINDNTPNAQSASYAVSATKSGNTSYVVSLCQTDGTAEVCTDSVAANVNIKADPNDLSSWDAWTQLDNSEWLAKKAAGLPAGNKTFTTKSDKKVGAYFVEWGVYGRDYDPKDIPVENLTHIYYGFIPVCGQNDSITGGPASALKAQCAGKQDYEVVIHDKFAALEKGDFDGTSKWDDPIKGTFAEMYRMKMTYPHIKILPSVGGWTLSDPLYAIGTEAGPRAIFIDSIIDLIDTYDFFDGIDIDWEFPGGGGANPNLGSEADTDGFATLMKELREALDVLEIKNNREYELAAAVNTGVPKLSKINWEAAAPYMDYINLMSYDFYGAWNTTFGHQTGIYPTPGSNNADGTTGPEGFPGTTPIAGFSLDEGVNHLLSRGVPSSKIIAGAAMYGRGWQGIQNGATDGPFDGNSTGGEAIQGSQAEGFWEDGIMDYKGAEAFMMGGANGTGINGYELFWDETAQASYLWNQAAGKLVTLDTARSVNAKGAYILANQLGGIFAWEIDADNGTILNAMHEGMGHK